MQDNAMIKTLGTINTSGTASKADLEGLLREVRNKPRENSSTEAKTEEIFLEVGIIHHCQRLQKGHVKQELIN